MDVEAQLRALDWDALTPLVERVVGDRGAEIAAVRSVRIAHVPGTPISDGLFRVSGSLRHGDAWSLVLKVCVLPEQGDEWAPRPRGYAADPGHYLYWRREARAYRSGLLDALPGGLRAPRCLAAWDVTPSTCWLWLEDVHGEGVARWIASDVPAIARALGRFNGAYLDGRPLPDQPWLSRGWLRGWVAERDGVVPLLGDADIWGRPPFSAARRAGLPGRLLLLWEERETLLAALDGLPKTLCHLDAQASNILLRREADGVREVVALDWAFMGLGPVGEDLAQFTGSLWRFRTAPEFEPERLEAAAFAAYVAGLEDAGWRGDPRAIRFAVCASGALRAAFAPLYAALRAAADDGQRSRIAARFGQPYDVWVGRVLRNVQRMLDHADEARELLRHGW